MCIIKARVMASSELSTLPHLAEEPRIDERPCLKNQGRQNRPPAREMTSEVDLCPPRACAHYTHQLLSCPGLFTDKVTLAIPELSTWTRVATNSPASVSQILQLKRCAAQGWLSSMLCFCNHNISKKNKLVCISSSS